MMENNSKAKVAATQDPSASMAASNERPSEARANTATDATAITAAVSAISHSQERACSDGIFISGSGNTAGRRRVARPEV